MWNTKLGASCVLIYLPAVQHRFFPPVLTEFENMGVFCEHEGNLWANFEGALIRNSLWTVWLIPKNITLIQPEVLVVCFCIQQGKINHLFLVAELSCYRNMHNWHTNIYIRSNSYWVIWAWPHILELNDCSSTSFGMSDFTPAWRLAKRTSGFQSRSWIPCTWHLACLRTFKWRSWR